MDMNERSRERYAFEVSGAGRESDRRKEDGQQQTKKCVQLLHAALIRKELQKSQRDEQNDRQLRSRV